MYVYVYVCIYISMYACMHMPSCWPVARHVRLRNPIKSALAHDAVAAVVLHKHRLIIRVGAGLIQFVYGSHSRLAADLTKIGRAHV